MSWEVYMVSPPDRLQRDLWPLTQVTITLGKGECPNILRSIGHRIEVDTETQSIVMARVTDGAFEGQVINKILA